MNGSMELLGFQVFGFRSIEDSGWIDTENITALIGTNEAGKTNLLIPLWKLKPAKDGDINPISDYPRKRFNEIRSIENKPVFIKAHFQLSEDLVNEIVEITGASPDDVSVASVARKYDGKYVISFPNAKPAPGIPRDEVTSILETAFSEIQALSVAAKAEETVKEEIIKVVKEAKDEVASQESYCNVEFLKTVKSKVKVNTKTASKRSAIIPRHEQLLDALDEYIATASRPSPSFFEDARKKVLNNLPSFVYYSNYGNLDSEIYLPHVIQNMERDDLGGREEAKARTLKVLFEFVRLEPAEILELGQEHPENQGQPSEAEIKAIAEKKKEREILLQSASVDLTKKFRDWWKQGEYRLRFQADGNHFRIWVSDEKRPEEIELEGRSTGLQWFLSFYLIFLVESADSHEDAILLLDEPGLSLHPLAQRDLSEFFENLSITNQLLYTTHSPFLVDPDHLDRVKAVYVDEHGLTAVSANLREGLSSSEQSKSIYPVHAALGLSVSDTLLQGCRPVIVEGPSDQFYLSAIKNYLIGKGLITPKQELIFIPAGGVRGVGAVVSMLAGKEEDMPYVVLDSDGPGETLAEKLRSGLYQGSKEKVLSVGSIVDIPSAEIEDLFPQDFLANIITRTFRGPEDDFSDLVQESQAIVPQVEAYAKQHCIALELGWKVQIAKKAKGALLKRDAMKDEQELLDKWKMLFEMLISSKSS